MSTTNSMSKTCCRPILIFGAGVLGKEALNVVKPVCFIDNNILKQKQGFNGYEVISFDEAKAKYPNAIIVIGAGRYKEDILDQASSFYPDIYDVDRLVDHKRIYLDQLNIVVTEKCTLRCVNCSSLIPLYKNPKHANGDTLLASIKAIINNLDFINRVEVLGGEPFLYPHLESVVELLYHSKIKKVDIITNGTMVPKKTYYLRHPRVQVVINDYESVVQCSHTVCNFNSAIQRNQLKYELSIKDIDFRTNHHWSWADMGPLTVRNRTKEELVSLFSRCNFNKCVELLHGKLYHCPRSSHGDNLGLIKANKKDYIDILNSKDLKEELRTFYNVPGGFITACNYCDGNTRETLNIKPGEQNA